MRRPEVLRRSSSAEDRRIWAVYALMRWCGLRNSEVAGLRWEWLKRGQRSFLWSFERRVLPDGSWYFPKGTARDVPVRWRILGSCGRGAAVAGGLCHSSFVDDGCGDVDGAVDQWVRA
jgi:integrase